MWDSPTITWKARKRNVLKKKLPQRKKNMKFPAEALDFCEESSAATPFKSHAERHKMSALVGIICSHFL